MTTIASRTGNESTSAPPRRLGLSGRLMLVTIGVVLLAQVLVFVPSLAMFRRSWLNDRLVGAKMVALVLAAYPEGTPLPKEVEDSLVAGIPTPVVALRGSGTRWLVLRAREAGATGPAISLQQQTWFGPLRGLLRTVFRPTDRPRRVMGPGVAGVPEVEHVEVLFEESYLREAMLDFTRNFLLVSLLVSAIAAGLMFLVLHRFLVRPVHRLTTSITSFAEAPEDAARIIAPSGRTDEIGVAERALARMQASLATELRQKRRLAEIGLAVSKINHELRNMLTTAQLLGDRLSELDDPTAKSIAPRLIRTLDRAIEFCGATLAFGRAVERPPQLRPVALRPLASEVAELARLEPDLGIQIDLAIPENLTVMADAEQIGRALSNLVRNAVQALGAARTAEPRITIEGWREDGKVMIRVADNGPGIPARLRDRIFGAFESSERPDGTGLGLNIADELIRLHGGRLVLEPATPGASFLICLPDRAS